MENRSNEEVLPMGEGQERRSSSWLSHPCETEVSSVGSREKYKEDHKSVALVSRAWEVGTVDTTWET